MQPRPTRRQLLAAGTALSASALLGPGLAEAAPAPPPSDSAVLARTLRVEQLVVTAYRNVLGAGVVTAAVASRLRTMLAQELAHVAALERALRDLGAVIPQTGASAAQRELSAHQVHLSLTRLPTQHECLRLLIDVESLAEGAYFGAISKLTDPGLLRTSAEAMGCEAQHWTVLSALQHHGDVTRSVPYPF
ncbi:MAG TPA: ferritin-like domain-containing protein, partial [Solirubrobacteraceae bacterium]|nr:ferritin-like domain-containing protein [Solirubrobacteraceae bacterium]